MTTSPLTMQITRLAQALRTILDDALRATGVTYTQFTVLAALQAQPGLTNAALARAGLVTPQTMHDVIRGLERAGLVVRLPDNSSKHQIRFYLSNAGEGIVAETRPLVMQIEQRMQTMLTADEQKIAEGVLQRCCAALGDCST